jgi:hypothetical protein
MENKAARGDVKRREATEDPKRRRVEADLFLRLAQSGRGQVFVRLAGPTGKRDLPGVLGQVAVADGEDDVEHSGNRIERYEARPVADIVGNLTRVPPRPRSRCHAKLGREARERIPEGVVESLDEGLVHRYVPYRIRAQGPAGVRSAEGAMVSSLSMADRVFPESFVAPVVEPTPVVKVVRREPLTAIREVLSISIDEIVNHGRSKSLVADFYRISRRIENEAWLRRQLG